jgi:monofunctional glycosyltransferase
LTNRQWLRLVAAGIAPNKFNLLTPDAELDRRVGRIERLLANKCTPRDARDVWLEGCA